MQMNNFFFMVRFFMLNIRLKIELAGCRKCLNIITGKSD